MKNFSRYPALSLFAILLVIVSCSREEFLIPITRSKQPITVLEAKVWTESYLKQNSTVNQPYSKREFLWKQAVMKQAKNGISYVQVPLEEDSKVKRVIYDYTAKVYVLAPKLQVIISRDKEGKIQLQVMELMSTGEYATSHQGFTDDKDYSGIQILQDWEGKFIKGSKFENGKVTGLLKPIIEKNKGARLQDCERWVIEYIYIGCVLSNGDGTTVSSTTTYPLGSPHYPDRPDQNSPFSYINCYGDWTPNGTIEFEICSPESGYDPYNPSNPSNPSDPFNPTSGSGPTVLRELYNNKKGLFGPCPGLTDNWRQQIDFKATGQIRAKLDRLAAYGPFYQGLYSSYPSVPNNWYVQSISSAVGTLVNLDNFSVFMSDLPVIDML